MRDGHRVTIVTNRHFEPLIRRCGLDFEEVGTVEEHIEVTGNPDIWNPLKFRQDFGAENGLRICLQQDRGVLFDDPPEKAVRDACQACALSAGIRPDSRL